MVITLILLIGWILILNSKSLKTKWLYVSIFIVALFILGIISYNDEDWTGY